MANIDLTLNGNNQLAIIKVTGEVTTDDIITGIQAHYGKGMATLVLWDFREATIVSITSEGFETIAHTTLSKINDREPGKTALVGDTNLNMGLGVMYRAIANMAGIPHEYKIFRDISDAMQWLLGT